MTHTHPAPTMQCHVGKPAERPNTSAWSSRLTHAMERVPWLGLGCACAIAPEAGSKNWHSRVLQKARTSAHTEHDGNAAGRHSHLDRDAHNEPRPARTPNTLISLSGKHRPQRTSLDNGRVHNSAPRSIKVKNPHNSAPQSTCTAAVRGHVSIATWLGP